MRIGLEGWRLVRNDRRREKNAATPKPPAAKGNPGERARRPNRITSPIHARAGAGGLAHVHAGE